MKNRKNDPLNVLGIIPARGGSKGIPKKNLIKINEKPLLYYTINASLSSRFVTKTIVTSDDATILKKTKELGAIGIKRPQKLANSSSQIESSIEYTLEYLKKHEKYVPDLIVLLQNTSPLRNAKHIDAAIQLLLKKKYDSVLSGYPAHEFLWKIKNGNGVPINYDPNNRPNRQQINQEFLENGAIYITKYSAFMKSKCRISGKIGIYEMSKEDSIQIDTKGDIEMVKNMLKTKENFKN